MPRNTLRSLAFAALAALGAAAHGQDLMTWGLVNFDPNNTSRSDLARQLMQEKLGAYTHTTVVAPIPRIVSEIRSGAHWCWAGAIRTEEREGFASLSVPFMVTLPQRIIVRKESRARFPAPLSLESLLQDRTLRTGIARSRSYSPAIDALFQRHAPSLYTSGMAEAIQMLLADRLDYVVEDAGVAMAHARQQGREDELLVLPFKEMAPQVLGHVMCPGNDWGRKAIADINAVLLRERPTARYRAIVETYHTEDDKRTLRLQYDEVFLKARP